ncbi:hypothetical protein BDV93DRAFT_605820 [Ceratobasidium sp. AG-I]|nr:hypothetical protein BDV93DRAFT_605820 [Ceratobasidium sp. AG-I]
MAGQEQFPVGAHVYYFDDDGRQSHGQVKSFELAPDGTKIARIRLEGTGSMVALPLAFVSIISPPELML